MTLEKDYAPSPVGEEEGMNADAEQSKDGRREWVQNGVRLAAGLWGKAEGETSL